MVPPRTAVPFVAPSLAEEVRALRKLGNDRRTASLAQLLNRIKAARSRDDNNGAPRKQRRAAA